MDLIRGSPGYSGDANMIAATVLKPKPRNFQTATIDDLPRARLGAAMTSFESVRSPAEIAAVAHFVETEFLLNRATQFGKHDGRPHNAGTKIASSVAVTQVK